MPVKGSVRRSLRHPIEHAHRPFLLPRVQVAISAPRELHVRVPEPSGDFLDVDTLIGKERDVGVTKVVDADGVQSCGFCVARVSVG
jgi:hypothetical protein